MPDWIRSLLLKVFRGHNGEKPMHVIERETDAATGQIEKGTQTIRKRKRSLRKEHV